LDIEEVNRKGQAMGLDSNDTKGLLHAKAQGVDYLQSAIIGRHKLHLAPFQLTKNLDYD
jgi:hypothetical protein